MTDRQFLKQPLLLERPITKFKACGNVNPATFPPEKENETPDHYCSQFLILNYAARKALTILTIPSDNPDVAIFTDGSLHAHAAIWKERQFIYLFIGERQFKMAIGLGVESTYHMASRLFKGKNVMKTLKNIIKRCKGCQKNNPKTENLAKSRLQQSEKYPGEDWEIDFTHMPKANGYSCLRVWVDTFTGCIEAFPCHSEQVKEVIKFLIHELIPRFGLPRSLQSNNGSTYKSAVTQGGVKSSRNRIPLTLFLDTSILRKG